MLVQRLRRWTNIQTTLVIRLMFAGLGMRVNKCGSILVKKDHAGINEEKRMVDI